MDAFATEVKATDSKQGLDCGHATGASHPATQPPAGAITFKQSEDSKETLDRILHPLVKQWFYSRFPCYSVPQKMAVMEIHSRQNVLVSAPTGATKTLTGFLSIINELVDLEEKGLLEDRIYCVYVSPLKALSNDIEKNLKEPLQEMEAIAQRRLGIRVAVRTGDTTQSERSRMLAKPPHIFITTPESLAILLASPKFSAHFEGLQWAIVDEVHALAENKRGVHLSLALERLQEMAGHMSRVGLSATIAPIEDIARFLVGSERPCTIIDVQYLKELDLQVMSPVSNIIGTPYEARHRRMYELIHELVQQHTSTLVFTNTRAATERVVHNLKDRWPQLYAENIGAHHGSLSKEQRLSIEERLRRGELRCVVCSTSLELGIDIGYLDLVILLGSPKSVARCLQRIGRSGHRLHEKAKGRIIVMDRDDMVECGVLLKSAMEKKIDRIHIPHDCLDVLAQHIYGTAIAHTTTDRELYDLVRRSYCYRDLGWRQFMDVIDYLAGRYVSLEERHIYAKIWHDEQTGQLGRRGRMARVLYMTNIGTIPDESYVEVRVGDAVVGYLDEAFLERLKPGDIFVLGGNVYSYRFSRGMVAYCGASPDRPPTVPQWFSEMLPLSFDLAMEIGRFRRLVAERLNQNMAKEEIVRFIRDYLYADETTADSIHGYLAEQHRFSMIPHDRLLLVEIFSTEEGTTFCFHCLAGRRVNHALSHALGFALSRLQSRDVAVGYNDNGFFVQSPKKVQAVRAFELLRKEPLRKVLAVAIDRSETLLRRFRHCAGRSLMILRNYRGRTKRVGRQQVSSRILLNAVKRISQDFPILAEARREVLEDLMDVERAQLILDSISDGTMQVKELSVPLPSPFSLNLVTQGVADTLKIEDRAAFLQRMHQQILAQIALKERSVQKARDDADSS